MLNISEIETRVHEADKTGSDAELKANAHIDTPALAKVIRGLLNLHKEYGDKTPICNECGYDYPCSTVEDILGIQGEIEG